MAKGMTYKDAGIDYDAIDPFKRMAQEAARQTASALDYFGFSEVTSSRGESAYLIELPDCYLAHVEEGLGTKNLVADAMYRLTGKTYYGEIAQDTVAMIVNDMITSGALPVSLALHCAADASPWFKDERRSRDFVEGLKEACFAAGCIWGPGETATLKDMILPDTCIFGGSAWGIVKP